MIEHTPPPFVAYISFALLGLIGWLGARFAGTWLVWTHSREWSRGYMAENAGRTLGEVPPHYGPLGRRAWEAGWRCSHDVTPWAAP